LLDSFRDFVLRPRSNRVIGAALALVVEALLVLLVLSMALVDQKPPNRTVSLVSVNVERPAEVADKRPEPAKPRPATSPETPRTSQPIVSAPAPQLPVPIIIPVTKSAIPSLPAPTMPPRPPVATSPARGMMGPPDMGVPGDSKRVGTAPGGQPMYAASWYREPYDDELRGYLSTAKGPGWALITCRTVADFRVDDCVGLDEYPENSNLLRAVLAAAWQFQVRPPRIGGVSKVGEWVRIRIEYNFRPS
jgi:protein TonB